MVAWAKSGSAQCSLCEAVLGGHSTVANPTTPVLGNKMELIPSRARQCMATIVREVMAMIRGVSFGHIEFRLPRHSNELVYDATPCP